LLLGSVPILKTSEMDYFYHDLPVIIVGDWRQVTKDFLEDNWIKYKTELDDWKKKNPNWLKAEFWLNRVRV